MFSTHRIDLRDKVIIDQINRMSPRVSVKKYLNAATHDMISILDYIIAVDPRLVVAPETEERFQYSIDNGAFAINGRANLISEQQAALTINLGTLLALDDLFNRASCDENFLADYWSGGSIIKTQPIFDFSPELRYFDYSTIVQLANAWQEMQGNMLPGVVVPVGMRHESPVFDFYTRISHEQERQGLANFLTAIGVSWVVLHEEAHYNFGHLHYLKSRHEKAKSPTQTLSLDETSLTQINVMEPDVFRVLELQADHAAASMVVDIFFTDEMLDLIPYPDMRNPIDLMRIIMVAIGGVCLCLERAKRQNTNLKNSRYPSPMARLVNSLIDIYQRPQLQSKWALVQNTNKISLDPKTIPHILKKALLDLGIINLILNGVDIEPMPIIEDILVNETKGINLDFVREWRELFELERTIVVDRLLEYRIRATPEHEELIRRTGGKN